MGVIFGSTEYKRVIVNLYIGGVAETLFFGGGIYEDGRRLFLNVCACGIGHGCDLGSVGSDLQFS